MNPQEVFKVVTAESEDVSLTAVFHRLNSVLPENQRMVTVTPETKASEALQVMRQHGFSQLPVIVGNEVLGLFSYRSFGHAVLAVPAEAGSRPTSPLDLTVDECIEKAEFARVTDEFSRWFDALDSHDAVVVGEPDRLLGIVTAMDVLRYLYGVASPFVMVAEIELAIRALIRCAADETVLTECARTALSSTYEPEPPPIELEEMTFHDYLQIIGDGRNWSHFEAVFGGTRQRTRARLEQMNKLRNSVFHFRKVTPEEYERLADHRDWMLMKARAAEARAKGGV